MNRKVKIFFSFCLTIVFLYIAFKDIDLNEFYIALKNIDWSVITLISVMTIISILIRAWRWQILLRTLKDIPYKSVFSFTIIGLMANNVLPAHAGEFIRAFYLGKREKVSVVSAFTTIFVERLFDFISIALFFFMILPLVTMPLWIRNVGLTVGGVSLVLIGVCIILASNKGNRGSFLAKVLSKLPAGIEKKMQTLLNSFFVGIGMLRRWQNFAYIFLVSIFLWIQMIATIYILLWGYGLHINLALAAATTMIVSVFAVVIPSSPGYFGVLQLAFIFALSFFNVGKSDALAVSVIYHLTQYIPITIGGILFLFKEGLSFQSMAISAKEGCDIKTEQIKSC